MVEFTKLMVKIDDDIYIEVEYRWSMDGDKADIYIRYVDGHMDSRSFGPDAPLNDSGARDLAHEMAVADYQLKNQATD